MQDHLGVVRTYPCPPSSTSSLAVRPCNPAGKSDQDSEPSAHGSNHYAKYYARTQSNASHPYARQEPAEKPSSKRGTPPGFDTHVYRCLWRVHFGGNCEYSFTRERTQAHDRHILTHLPDDEGYSRVNFVCKACPAKSCRTYCRLDAVARHIRVDHGTKDSELSQILGVPWCKPTFIHSTTAVLPY